jgi:uncharacterized membrane protein YgaE (UPF0421/DUF939 family)
VLLAMAAAVLFSPVPMFVNQSAASAILVVALRSGGIAGERLIDAWIGGGCALLISLLRTGHGAQLGPDAPPRAR